MTSFAASCQLRIFTGYALASPRSFTPITWSSGSRKSACSGVMNTVFMIAGMPSFGTPPEKISVFGTMALSRLKAVKYQKGCKNKGKGAKSFHRQHPGQSLLLGTSLIASLSFQRRCQHTAVRASNHISSDWKVSLKSPLPGSGLSMM